MALAVLENTPAQGWCEWFSRKRPRRGRQSVRAVAEAGLYQSSQQRPLASICVASAEAAPLGLGQVLPRRLRESRPGEQLRQAIPRPGDVRQPLSGAFVGQPDAHEQVLVGRLRATRAYIAAKGPKAQRTRGEVAFS